MVLSAAINLAVREWKWLPENPMKGVRRPEPGKARERRISEDESEQLFFALGYERDGPPLTQSVGSGRPSFSP